MNDTRFDFKYLRSRRIFPSALVKCAFITLPLVVGGGSSLAQVETARSLAERSAIVVRGTVLRVNASEQPLQAASPRTAVIKVLRMY